MNNAERSEKIAVILEQHYEEDILADLLSDSMHYAKRHDVDFECELRMARMHVDDET